MSDLVFWTLAMVVAVVFSWLEGKGKKA